MDQLPGNRCLLRHHLEYGGPGDDTPAEQPLAARIELMRGAAALLNPITWREPFGLVMVEALASATPMLAFPNGAAPEIIDSARTGFLCRDEEEMTAGFDRVPEIERRQCRAAAEQRFSIMLMARDYQRLCRACSSQRGPPGPRIRSRRGSHQCLTEWTASAGVVPVTGGVPMTLRHPRG